MYLYKKMKLMKPIIIIRKSQIVNRTCPATLFRRESSIVNRSAFTLIELLISVSLATILILVTAMIFKQASSAFSESDARNEVYQNVRAAFDIIKRDISGATLNTNREWFKGELNTIEFLSSTSNDNDQPITLIKYFLNGNTLNKSENSDTVFLNDPISAFGAATSTGILGLNVKTLQFRYQDRNGSWGNTWDSITKRYLPDAVEVKMTVSDTRNRYIGTSTNIISIP
jgi:prepilin-type N-terminal cleavage/methylation domain